MGIWEDSVYPALLGTLLTWGVTAAGSAMVFALPAEGGPRQKKTLDTLLGFAAGVMTAASYWSLLAPALEFAQAKDSVWRDSPALPVILGFSLGGGTMALTDVLLQRMGLGEDSNEIDLIRGRKEKADDDQPYVNRDGDGRGSSGPRGRRRHGGNGGTDPSLRDTLSRRPGANLGSDSPQLARTASDMEGGPPGSPVSGERKGTPARPPGAAGGTARGLDGERGDAERWRRMFLLVIAITLHNLPEGLAVGVGFGSAGVISAAAKEVAAAGAG
eukprot:CAMPEP_0172584932 /NCGR_PEP_ID=MMETSP1068-20121228/4461_1 /TAXON_ID=35684 /ORGANISM="Pseudopedinella elastica, Strain CCMP716" /LENGTH=272 /DNA_ID=CAMNT_0013379249 /DNA_START=99 /DNA_END=913 /DNA_ORIENTATION=-